MINQNDLTQQTDRVLAQLTKIPDQLDKLVRLEEQHTQLLLAIDSRMASIKQTLYPGRDVIAKGLPRQKLSGVVRQNLLLESAKLLSNKRKLKASRKAISIKLVAMSRKGRTVIVLGDLRKKVNDPNYYIKYAKFIVPAFANWLGRPMTQKLYDKLVELKGTDPAQFDESLAKVLITEDTALYIRSTGNAAMKAEFFASFRKLLLAWDPRTARIKK